MSTDLFRFIQGQLDRIAFDQRIISGEVEAGFRAQQAEFEETQQYDRTILGGLQFETSQIDREIGEAADSIHGHLTFETDQIDRAVVGTAVDTQRAIAVETSQIDRELAQTEWDLGQHISTEANVLSAELDQTASFLSGQIQTETAQLEEMLADAPAIIVDQIVDQLTPIIETVVGDEDALTENLIQTVLDGTRELVEQIDAVETEIAERTQELAAAIEDTEGGILSLLNTNADRTIAAINDAETGIQTQLTDLTQAVFQPATDWIGTIGDNVTRFLQALIGNLATADDFALQLLQRVGAEMTMGERDGEAVKGVFLDLIFPELGRQARGFLEKLELELSQAVRVTTSELNSMPDLPPGLRLIIEEARNPGAPAFLPILIGLALSALGAGVTASYSGALDGVRQESGKRFPNTIPTVSELAALDRRGQLTDERRADLVSRNGVNDENWALFRALETQLLSPDSLLDLELRDPTRAEFVTTELERLGYARHQIDTLRQLRFLQPTPSDAIRFLVREVFSPDIVAAFGQDQDYPGPPQHPDQTTADDLFRKIGISPELARQYWAAHWELPSPTQGFEMLHRTSDTPQADGEPVEIEPGKTVWRLLSQSNLEMLLRARDIMPFWRDKLTQINYHPLTRVDVRRMHKIGVLDRAGVVKAYLDLGYDLPNAQSLADFTVQLNTKEKEADIEPFRTSLRGKVMRAYEDGTLSAAQMREAMTGLLYTDAQIAAFRAEADFIRAADMADEIRAGVRKFYIASRFTEDEARGTLAASGFDDAEIDRLIPRWRLARQFQEITDEQKANRELTKAEILALYEQVGVEREEAKRMLTDLGYDDRESDALLSLSDVKLAKATMTAEKDRVKTLYVGGRIGRDVASSELDRLGVPERQRDALIAAWDLSRESKTELIPLTLIQQGVKAKIFGIDDAREELELHGFSARKQDQLIRLFGGQIPPDKPPKEERVPTLTDTQIRNLYLDRKIDQAQAIAYLKARRYTDDHIQRLFQLWGDLRG